MINFWFLVCFYLGTMFVVQAKEANLNFSSLAFTFVMSIINYEIMKQSELKVSVLSYLLP